MAYNAAKAEAFNKARAQGLSYQQAAKAAGLTAAEIFASSVDTNGVMGPLSQGVPTDSQGNPIEQVRGAAAAQARAEENAFYQTGLPSVTPYAQTANTTPGVIRTREYTETSTTTVSGGGSTTIVATPARPTAASQALDAQAQQTQREIEALQLANSGFGSGPQLTEQQQALNDARILSLQQQYNSQRDAAESAKAPSPPSINVVPNTTTTVSTVAFEKSVEVVPVSYTGDPAQITRSTQTGTITRDTAVSPQSDPSQFPAYDDDGNLQSGFAINPETGETYFQGVGPVTRDTPVRPQSDPSQFPAYDDEGNLQLGFAINPETGDTYYQGFRSQDVKTASPISDPYYGLTPTQLQDLGGADPTDPYIRARLGIPQLPGSTLVATPGFGTIKTGIPAIDSALGIIGGGITSLFTNFSNTIGGLFGPKPTASAAAATTGMSVAGLTTPAPTPPTRDTPVNPASDPSQFPAYDDDGNLQPGFAINDETGDTYFQGVGPVTRDTPVRPQSDPSQFPAYDDDGNLQPGFAINDETGDTYYQGFRSQDVTNRPVNPASDPSQFPAYDDDGNLQPGFAINDETGDTYYQGFRSQDVTNRPVNPASDPSQFPAYDDEGNLQPGFAINDETGDTYYQGFERNTDQPFQADLDPEYANYSVAGLTEPEVDNPANVNDPYYGLTSQQLQDLGGADPTDPYIRARLGIPQLPGSTLAATPGFGTIKTGVPIIDNALSFIGGLFGSKPAAPPTPAAPPVSPTSDPSQFPAYDDDGNLQPGFAINPETGETYYQGFEKNTDQPVNPASDPSQFPAYDDDGNLQPGFAINEETGETYYQGLGPATQQSSVNPASDPSQFPAYDDEGNLQPGFAVNDETGETYFQGVGPATGSDITTLSDEETAALFEGTDTPTAAQQAATNEQTAADAAALYPGTDNTNLKNINDASAAIAANEAGIANAQDIIDRNNAELADPNISDERRAELEANNEAQFEYIQTATENTAINENVIEANADAFAAGGGEPDSGQAPLEVAALEDPGLATPEEDDVVEVTEAETVPLTEEEAAALFEEEVSSTVEVTEAETVPLTDEETAALFAEEEESAVEADAAEDVDANEDEALQEPPGADPEFTELAEPVDPDADPELLGGPEPEVDPFTELAEPVDPDADPELLGGPEPEVDTTEPLAEPPDVDAAESPELLGGPDEEPGEPELLGGPDDVDTNTDEGLKTPDGQEEAGGTAGTGLQEPTDADVEQANQEAAVRDRARQQATFQARYKQPGNADWRVRLSLAPNSQYLYNEKDSVGILAPLTKTDGVIFPYTPNITTTYSAQYEQYDLVHSNYRGLFYKNSRVGDIQIRGTFTAQDTVEADYLLAVIHFFRSATKMFYGQDPLRGTPPPVCLLNGFGQYQFSDHPVVISSFNYSLPNDVDYIRAGSPNNYGLNMLNRRAAVASNPGGQSLPGLNRLTNALLKKGAPGKGVPDPNSIQQNVSNTAGASYVPTKMEIDITLIPVQTRTQVSKQFSLQGFANGQLLKGGFW